MKIRIAKFTIIILLLSLNAYGEETIYCVNDGGLNNSQFCKITALEPEPVPLGPTYEKCDIEALDILPVTGDIYAAAGDDTPRASHLYHVSPTGDIVDLGDIGGPNFLREVDAISFNPVTHELWGWAQDEGLFVIPTLTPPLPSPFPPSPFLAIPQYPIGIPILPEVNAENPVCKKPTSQVPIINAELVFKSPPIEVEDITWNRFGDVLYAVENVHSDEVDEHGETEDKWSDPSFDFDFDEGIRLWAYYVSSGELKQICDDVLVNIEDPIAEIEALEVLPNRIFNPPIPLDKDVIMLGFHGPNKIHYFTLVTPSPGQETCKLTEQKTSSTNKVSSLNDIEGIGWKPIAIFDSTPKPGSLIDFGKIPVESMAINGIMIMNNGDKRLEISKIEIVGEHAGDFSVSSTEPFTIPENSDEYKLITIKCIPLDKGLRNATLKFYSNDLDNSTPSYQLSCEGETSEVALTSPLSEVTTKAEVTAKLSSNIVGSLGYGYSSLHQEFKPQSCFYGDVTEVGNSSADLSFEYIGGYEELARYFNLKAGGEFNFSFFSLDGKSEYVSSYQETKLSRSLFFKYKVKLPNGQFNQNGLNYFGQNMLNLNDPDRFRKACGDYFIFQTERGAQIILSFQFNFANEVQKKNFFASAGTSFFSFTSIKSAVDKSSTEIKEKSSITLRAYQEGGSADKLIDIFGTDNNILNCSFKDFYSCEKALNNAINYAKDTFSPSVSKSLPVIMDYIFSSYENAGIPISPEIVPLTVLATRQQIGHEYEKQYTDLLLATQWSDKFDIYRATLEEHDYLSKIKNELENNILFLRRAVETCFDRIDSCLSEKEEIFQNFLKDYDRDWLHGIYIDKFTEEYLDSKDFWFDHKYRHGFAKRGCATLYTRDLCLPSNCRLYKDIIHPEGYEIKPLEEKGVGSKNIYFTTDRCANIKSRGCSPSSSSNGRYKGYLTVYGQCIKYEDKIVTPPVPLP